MHTSIVPDCLPPGPPQSSLLWRAYTIAQSPTEPICSKLQCATGGTEVRWLPCRLLAVSQVLHAIGSHSSAQVVATTEKQVAEISSGGGFSNFAPRPLYQTTVVNQYLTKYAQALPPSRLFNITNRGFPDVRCTSPQCFSVCAKGNAGESG
jgi:hypothetical protein